MQLRDMVQLAKGFTAMGWSVQEQLEQLLAESTTNELNPSAVEAFKRWIEGVRDLALQRDDSDLVLSCEYWLDLIEEDRL